MMYFVWFVAGVFCAWTVSAYFSRVVATGEYRPELGRFNRYNFHRYWDTPKQLHGIIYPHEVIVEGYSRIVTAIKRRNHVPSKIKVKLMRGRGHWSQVSIDRPDPLREVSRQARMMEESGQLKDPASQWAVKMKLKKLREQEHQRAKVDYQARGGEAHPLKGVE